MTHKKLILILLGFVTLCGAIDNNKIFDKIITTYSKISSYKADFSQTNYWTEMDMTQISSGKIIYNNEKLILKYYQPKGQILFLNKTTLKIYDAEQNQMIITTLNNTAKLKPIDVLLHYKSNANISITQIENNYFLKLDSLDDEQIKSIEAKIDGKSFLIKDITYNDITGNSVKYEFQNESINKTVSSNDFVFDVPEDVTIINN